jgi:transposase
VTIAGTRAITGGAGTHADTHVAAALDPVGGLLGVREFPATSAGYAGLLGWLGGFGTVCLVGIEGTGSYCDTRPHVLSELVEEVWLMPET